MDVRTGRGIEPATTEQLWQEWSRSCAGSVSDTLLSLQLCHVAITFDEAEEAQVPLLRLHIGIGTQRC